MSEITHKQASSDLAITEDQTTFNELQLAELRHMGVATNNPADIAMFFHYARQTGLDPFLRELYMITRKGRPTIQTGINGFYKIAQRAGDATGDKYSNPETYWCGDDGAWRDVWLPAQPPAAAKVVVMRGQSRFTAVALTREYMPSWNLKPESLWVKYPSRMIAKCAEALAIRKAFPDVTSGLYTSEEMAQAGPGDQPQPQPQAPQPQKAPQAQGPADTVDDLVALLPDATTLDEVTDIGRRLTQINAPADAIEKARARWTEINNQNTTEADADVEDAEEVDAA